MAPQGETLLNLYQSHIIKTKLTFLSSENRHLNYLFQIFENHVVSCETISTCFFLVFLSMSLDNVYITVLICSYVHFAGYRIVGRGEVASTEWQLFAERALSNYNLESILSALQYCNSYHDELWLIQNPSQHPKCYVRYVDSLLTKCFAVCVGPVSSFKLKLCTQATLYSTLPLVVRQMFFKLSLWLLSWKQLTHPSAQFFALLSCKQHFLLLL